MTDRQPFSRIVVPALLTVIITAVVIGSSGRALHHEVFTGSARAGLDIWRRENCIACHAVFGLGGHMAPDLTNTYRRRGAQYIAVVLKNGLLAMPDLELSDAEVDVLIMYLQHIDGLGQYPLPRLGSPPFGQNDQ